MSNLTIFTDFVLIDMSISQELQVVPGLLLLLIYLGTLTGNLVTVTVIVTNPYLHSQMYFFTGNLSLKDLCCISVTDPKFIVNSLTGTKLVSLPACAAQIFLVIFFGSTELAFLLVVSYDCYVALCHPLHHGLTITLHLCTQAAAGSWASGLVYSSLHTGTMFRLPFTGSSVIHQYFCDILQILRISSSDVPFSEFAILAISVGLGLLCSALLFMSYREIFSVVLRIHSVKAHNKGTPQLVVLLIFTISGFIAVLGPNADKASLRNLLTDIFYTMLSPLINHLIYSLQNREINTALGRMFHRYFEFPRKDFVG